MCINSAKMRAFKLVSTVFPFQFVIQICFVFVWFSLQLVCIDNTEDMWQMKYKQTKKNAHKTQNNRNKHVDEDSKIKRIKRE